jgi:hypothetical protein
LNRDPIRELGFELLDVSSNFQLHGFPSLMLARIRAVLVNLGSYELVYDATYLDTKNIDQLFLFVKNNPLNYFDLLGLGPEGQIKDPDCIADCALEQGICLSAAGGAYATAIAVCARAIGIGRIICLTAASAGYAIAVAACNLVRTVCDSRCECVDEEPCEPETIA